MKPQRISSCRRTGTCQVYIPLTDLERRFRHARIESTVDLTRLSGNLIPQHINRDIQKDGNLRNRSQLARQLLDLLQQVR